MIDQNKYDWRQHFGPITEAEHDEHNRVQIEFGCDEKDVWLVFNRRVSAVVMTHNEAKTLAVQLVHSIREKERENGVGDDR
jgi:hypothetical protein